MNYTQYLLTDINKCWSCVSVFNLNFLRLRHFTSPSLLLRHNNCPHFPLLPLYSQLSFLFPVNALPILRFGLVAICMCLSELIGLTAAFIRSHEITNNNVKYLLFINDVSHSHKTANICSLSLSLRPLTSPTLLPQPELHLTSMGAIV